MPSRSAPDLDWLTCRQVADALQMHIRTVRRWAGTDPEMPVKRIGQAGGGIRIHRSFVEQRLGKSPAEPTA
ncbi:hypothetical protein AB0N09_21770 [Streptomyces erythrochromogenes]|uniref:hypothetical protein n=1 Tax=Streptomyces erythrochromogenes TaxID=285574 RepID=UPI003433DE9B